MKLKVINSGSVGNCYLLISDTSTLILECGVSFKEVKIALNFDLTKVCGAIITHEHLDHCKAVKDVVEAGINVYASPGTIGELKVKSHRLKPIEPNKPFMLNEFRVMPFDVKHDCKQPYGYMIHHPECGNLLFITDSYYVKYTFPNLNNILVEANYSEEVINERMWAGSTKGFVRDRVIQSHMSLKTCMDLLRANDLKAVNNIVLIHLSDTNSDAGVFKKEITNLTGKNVHVAVKGMVLNLSKTPF